ncbi:MAG: hypothetical protein RIG26_03650 [Thalassospira sp.]|uniref:hypothetical protein n=1 Tax=Thalassospira sp. TaxID=1912094 RepID=UPI0032EAE809
MPALRSRVQITVRILCVIALMLVGVSHKLASFGPIPDSDLASFALPDGTLPVLCLSGQISDPDNNAGLLDSCEFCRIASAVILPDNPSIPERIEFTTRVFAHLPKRLEHRLNTRDTPNIPRAPPFIV